MDAGRKIAEAEYHNWELTLLFGKNAYKRDDYFWDTDLQEIYDQARNASNNKDAFSAGFTAGQTMFTIEILSLIVGALESGGSSSGGQQVVLPGVGEVIPGDAAGSVAGVLPPGSILRDQENKKESEEEGKGDSETGDYKAPEGGGGVTDNIKVGDTEVNFGHGGRHLEGTGLSANDVNQAIAKDVVSKNPGTGQFYKGQIDVNGVTIEYTSYGVKDGVINVGTYYPAK